MVRERAVGREGELKRQGRLEEGAGEREWVNVIEVMHITRYGAGGGA